MKKAIIIGASSGIGKELAHLLSQSGYALGITARRTALLEALKVQLPGEVYTRYMDVSQPEDWWRLWRILWRRWAV